MNLFPRYLARATAAGIGRTVLFAVFSRDYRTANRRVGELVASDADRFYGFAFVHAQRDRGKIYSMVREAVIEYGLCGIKAHRHDADISAEICDAARRLSLPVLYDVMGNIGIVDVLARDYPDVDFIIPHLGSFSDDWRVQGTFIGKAARYPNIHTDTAGVRRFDLVVEAVRRAGADKVLFGTDGPWLHPEIELEKILALKLIRPDEDLVLGGNFLRLTAKARCRSRAISA